MCAHLSASPSTVGQLEPLNGRHEVNVSLEAVQSLLLLGKDGLDQAGVVADLSKSGGAGESRGSSTN